MKAQNDRTTTEMVQIAEAILATRMETLLTITLRF